jgi:pimeloyl-ACP methyl ester carboxylesterase
VSTDTAATATSDYASASNLRVTGSNAVEYAYRDLGASERPLVLLQHFRGNLDNWDPALIDGLASRRRVITFDNVGVAGTTGTTPHTVEQMALDALTFLDALGLDAIDLLGFSIGSFVAQEIALLRPDLLRRLVLASAAPRGAPEMHGWAPDVIGAVGAPEPNPDGYLAVFYTQSSESHDAGVASFTRMLERQAEPDAPTTWQTRQAQYDAVCGWGVPDHARLERLAAIDVPVFVANGDSDPMILPRYSHLLAGLLPNASITIYPDSAHGFLFQHHAAFAADVDAFLGGA